MARVEQSIKTGISEVPQAIVSCAVAPEILRAVIPLNERVGSVEIQLAIEQVLQNMTMGDTVFRVVWDQAQPWKGVATTKRPKGAISLLQQAPLCIHLVVEDDTCEVPTSRVLRLVTEPLTLRRVPLLYRRRIRNSWAQIVLTLQERLGGS